LILFPFALWAVLPAAGYGQVFRPPIAIPAPPPEPSPAAGPAPSASPPVSPNINLPVRVPRPNAPDAEHVFIESVTQEVDGPLRHLRGMVRIETTDMQLKADELDYNSDTGDVQARGHVHFEHFARGEKIDCDRADYNIDDETGKFYAVTGSSVPRIHSRPGLLTTQNPFYFEAQWAERLKDRYILHDGFLTDCLVPRPWWTLRGPVFDVIPGERAIARRSWFYLARMPVFYLPIMYKSLEKEPRKSGFLIPTIGNSSTRGPEIGAGYYWAINRSFDLMYRGQYYTSAGLAHHVDFRGDVNPNTSFDFRLDGIKDTRNIEPSPSGFLIQSRGKANLGDGWELRGDVSYLSSFAFQQYYTESFNEAVFSETHSVGYLDKHFGDFAVYLVAQRNVSFQSTTPGDQISIRKLPEVQFLERDHELHLGGHPFWVSFEAASGLLRRSQPLFQTRQFVPRSDFAPHVTTAFHWMGIQLVPSFGVRETNYGSSVGSDGNFTGRDVLRSSRDFTADLILPSLERVFNAPAWMGAKVKHVIEPRVTYTNVSGIDNFAQIIRFDDPDILSNTNQVEFSLTNRLLTKDKNGYVTDFLSWQLRYDRYFDPTFGGALIPGERNAVASVLDLTGYSFLDGVRNSSPVVSVLRLQQARVGMEWRADYDPLRHHIVNSSASVDWRYSQYFFSAGHTDLKTDPMLAPSANQFRGLIGYGKDNRRGWGGAFSAYYDYLKGSMEFTESQVTYNTDCCGISLQYRRFNLGTRDESMIRFSFGISNIGTFGTLRRQERLF
jgi:LPS-assembly protein